MDCVWVLLAAAASGVIFGWEPVGDGSDGVEYVVELEPELVDVLQSGASVPIESYVPADVGPVRKVRIVVGRDEPIVRGQNADAPQSHTARFAADGWTDDRYRYDAAPAWPTNNSATTAAPPWPNTPLETARVAPAAAATRQTAPAWTGVGLEASPPPLLTPSMNSSPSTTSTTRLEPLTKNDRYLATPLEEGYRTATAGSDWERAAMATSNGTRQSRTADNSEMSVLALPDPSPTRLQLPAPPPLGRPSADEPATSTTGWDTGWGTSANNTSSAADADLVPVLPLSSRRQDQPQASAPQSARPSSPQASPWAQDDRWSWPTDGQPATGQPVTAATQPVAAQPPGDWPASNQSPTVPLGSDWPAATTTTASAADGWGDAPAANRPAATNPPPTTWPADFNTSPPVQTAATQPAAPISQPPAPNSQPLSGAPGASPQRPTSPQEPWLPLLLVSLGLAGSIGANLFLGWSYMDARQRYRSLVRKTTDAFHRATGAAA